MMGEHRSPIMRQALAADEASPAHKSPKGEPGSPPVPFRKRREEGMSAEAPYLLAGAAPPLFACALHSLRNFLRSLPCRPLASASLEHSIEAAVRGFSAFSLLAGAGAAVC